LSPKLLTAIALLGVGLLWYGERYYGSGRSSDGLASGVLPTLLGVALLVLDGVLFIAWRVQRDKPLSLEQAMRGEDRDWNV
jgi:hypothetical protein